MLLLLFGVLLGIVIGAVIGSFLAVVLDRSFRDEQFLGGRSYCESCNNKLSAIELIPIFSYLYQRGKCRYCYSKIPFHLFLFEIICALFFVSIVWHFYFNYINFDLPQIIISYLYLLALGVLLIYIFVSDYRYMAISTFCFGDLFVLYLLGMAINQYLINLPIVDLLFFNNYWDHFYGALAMFLFFWLTYFLSKEKLMGEGDVYLATLFGLFLGFKLSLVMWFLAFLIGALFGLALIFTRKKSFKSALPFGPFLIIGFVLAIFYGDLFASLLLYYI